MTKIHLTVSSRLRSAALLSRHWMPPVLRNVSGRVWGSGTAAFKVFLTFGGSTPPPEKLARFTTIRDEFKRQR